MKRTILLIAIFLLARIKMSAQPGWDKVQTVSSMLIFPLQPEHAHASCIASLPNDDLLAVWYQGSGERESNDVRILGARLKKGASAWSKPFLMADAPDLPDCNPVLFLNRHNKLYLVWITVLAHRWEYSLLRYKTSTHYLQGDGAPQWDWQGDILLSPGEEFAHELLAKYHPGPDSARGTLGFGPRYGDSVLQASRDLAKRTMGWMTRIKPLQVPGGRTLLPLYSDGFSMSLVAISDDDCESWRPSLPIVGVGDVQPALVQKKNGHILALMRDNGTDPNRVQTSESLDTGYSWTAAIKTNIPNTASVELLILKDGRYLFVGDDESDGRYRLSLYVSGDEGKTWGVKRALESVAKGKGSFSYPCVIQTTDGMVHISYSYSMPHAGESIKYIVVDPSTLR